MSTVTVSGKGQMVIPAELRKQLGIGPGTQLEIAVEGAGFRATVEPRRKMLRAADILGIAGYKGPKVPVEKISGLEAARRMAKQGKP